MSRDLSVAILIEAPFLTHLPRGGPGSFLPISALATSQLLHDMGWRTDGLDETGPGVSDGLWWQNRKGWDRRGAIIKS